MSLLLRSLSLRQLNSELMGVTAWEESASTATERTLTLLNELSAQVGVGLFRVVFAAHDWTL